MDAAPGMSVHEYAPRKGPHLWSRERRGQRGPRPRDRAAHAWALCFQAARESRPRLPEARSSVVIFLARVLSPVEKWASVCTCASAATVSRPALR